MTKRAELQPVEFIVPLNMNGLVGRMLVLPAPKRRKREILFIYNHHSTIEHWAGLLRELNTYGAVTAPDLPGFGGMQRLYAIGQKPTLDTLADYLAAFIKLRYKNRHLTIVGVGFGFAVVTRMLQRYPDTVKKVDLLISIMGFSHYSDFEFSERQLLLYKPLAKALNLRLPAWLIKHTVLRPFVMRPICRASQKRIEKYRSIDAERFNETVQDEIELWQASDMRTQLATSAAMLRVDNCRSTIALPVWHVAIEQEHYVDANRLEQHLRVIFSDVIWMDSHFKEQSGRSVADPKSLAVLIPTKLRQQLRKG